MLEQRLYRHIDWLLLGALLLLCAIGVAMIYSTTYDPSKGGASPLVSTQLWALALGLLIFVVTLSIDYRWFADLSVLLFIGLAGLVSYASMFGAAGGGARRWIDLGVFNLQPSEFARIVVALALATLFARHRRRGRTPFGWLLAVLIIGVPFVLIAQQPDLGTAVALLPVALAIFVFAGLPLRYVGNSDRPGYPERPGGMGLRSGGLSAGADPQFPGSREGPARSRVSAGFRRK